MAERLPAFPGVGVAAVNGPSTVVVSGPPQPVADLVEACQADGVRARLIPVDYASHSAAVQEVAERLRADLADVTPRPGPRPAVSTLTGDWVDPASMDAGYWYDNLRQTVRFDAAVRVAVEAGHTTFVEICPASGADDAGDGDPGRRRRRPGTRWAACAAVTTIRRGC